METKTREGMEIMGQTGAGLSSEDQITKDVPNQFTTKWGKQRSMYSRG